MKIARMMSVETMKECNGVDMSCKKTLTYGDSKSRGGDDGGKDNDMLLTFAIQ